MKLEVGMYVRTNKVGIKKIYKIDNNKTKYKYLYKLKNQDDDGCIDLSVLCEENIVKASYNIIDILEVGDYVNRLPVAKISEYIGTYEKYIELYGSCSDWENEDIKSVITHEQMEQMAYKVGE